MHDPFSGRPTFIRGATLPSADDQAHFFDDHQRRLAALDRVSAAAAECGFAGIPENIIFFPEKVVSQIGVSGDGLDLLGRAIRELRDFLPLLSLEMFGFNAKSDEPLPAREPTTVLPLFDSDPMESAPRPYPQLRFIGSGVELWAFQAVDGSVYKFFMPRANTSFVGATFRFVPGEDGPVFNAEAVPGSYRDLLEKLDLINRIGGMPTEVVGVVKERILVVKQVLGNRLPENSDASQHLPPSLIPWPARFLRCDRDHPRLAFVREQPWLVADLHERNIVLDTNGQPRIIDLVAAPLPREMVEGFPLLHGWLENVRRDPAASLLGTARDEDL